MTRREAHITGLAKSDVLTALGLNRFAAFSTVNIPGKIVWFNFELARELGMVLPAGNLMTPEFQRRLSAMLSVRVLRRGEELAGRRPALLYADKYGGADIGSCMGAGRAGFLPRGNLYLKGIGLTPLFRHDDPDDFLHSHGGAAMREGMIEAVFGEVNDNLFSRGSARILALVDQDDYTVYPDGAREPRAIVVRAGLQLRPAHLFARGVKGGHSKLDLFVNITRLTGQLLPRRAGRHPRPAPDLEATMLRVIDDHAVTAAEQFRWRMLHGALSLSNMEMSGAMLDTTTQSAQPRTAPLRVLSAYPDIVYGTEHLERAAQLQTLYRSLVKSIPAGRREALNAGPINFAAEMRRAYRRHLELQMLRAAGLKSAVALRLQTDYPHVAVRFEQTLAAMSGLTNPGSVNANNPPVEGVSVLDVFNLLRRYPAVYFAEPGAAHGPAIRDYLKPVFKGNRALRAKRRAVVNGLVGEFADAYAAVMRAGRRYAGEFYGGAAAMRKSVTARAGFENRPLNLLYRGHLLREFKQLAAAYKETGEDDIIERAVSDKIRASLRNVEALLSRGAGRPLDGGGVELERQTIRGVTYSVLAWDDSRQTRRLRVSVAVGVEAGVYVLGLARTRRLTLRELKRLRFRYALDGGRAAAEAKARLEGGVDDLSVNFYLSGKLPPAGELTGFFYVPAAARPITFRDGGADFRGYVYAVPDRHELSSLTESLRRRGAA
jgi:hypothetical protein